MTTPEADSQAAQTQRNEALVSGSRYLGTEITSQVLPFHIDIDSQEALTDGQLKILGAMEVEAARTTIEAVGSLSKLKEVDHMGGGLGMLPSLLLTLAVVDFERKEYTLENAHCSIGYFTALASYGYIDRASVIDTFRRGLDIPGHVAWLPGGTQLNGGRLGVMVPVAVGQALGMRARHGDEAWVICHCGDAGWISGQALNGYNAADLHSAPVTLVMDRNGIQLSGTNKAIMDKDPRPIIASMGVTILETPSLFDQAAMYAAYREAYALAKQGRPSLIYPVGFRSDDGEVVTLASFAARHGVAKETEALAQANRVAMDTEVWVPGSLMSYRDVESMLECLFLVNGLPGGKGHHDGHMNGRDVAAVLSNPMMQATAEQQAALDALRGEPAQTLVTTARPAPGTRNLVLPADTLAAVKLPDAGASTSARGGSQAGYAAVAKAFPDQVYVIGCDLDPSTKLDKARTFLADDHQFEMSIEEQASALMANGLAMASRDPQLVVFSTFAAFFEGIAREGFEMWRYQRNLNGSNEGLNVTFHMSHVGACTGRDHFSGWALDWVTLGIGYLPYLHRFYAPADARSAFLAVRDLAAHYGGHIIAIPRDSLPVLEKQDGTGALWEVDSPWEPVTTLRRYDGAKKAILAFGAPAFLAGQAAETLSAAGQPVDALIVNGLPLPNDALRGLFTKYPGGIVTVEDGIIATRETGLRGFAGLVSGAGYGTEIPMKHVGIVDPRIAPSEGHMEVWEHFGITAEALVDAVKTLSAEGKRQC